MIRSNATTQLNVLAFADLHIYNCCVFMHKVYHKLSSLHSFTRHSLHDFYLPQVIVDICKRCISFNGVQRWFQLSNNLKDTDSFSVFKSKLLVQLISKY